MDTASSLGCPPRLHRQQRRPNGYVYVQCAKRFRFGHSNNVDDAAALALISHWDWSTDDNADDPSSIDSGDDLNGVEKTKKFGKGKPKPMSLCQYNVEVCIKQGVGALFGIEASALGAAGKYSFAKRVGDIERYNEITARAAANVKEATGQAVSEDVLKRYRKQFNFRNWALSTARKMATATGVGAIVVSEATAVAYGVACTESIRKEPLMCPNQ